MCVLRFNFSLCVGLQMVVDGSSNRHFFSLLESELSRASSDLKENLGRINSGRRIRSSDASVEMRARISELESEVLESRAQVRLLTEEAERIGEARDLALAKWQGVKEELDRSERRIVLLQSENSKLRVRDRTDGLDQRYRTALMYIDQLQAKLEERRGR